MTTRPPRRGPAPPRAIAPRPPTSRPGEEGLSLLYGWHAVREALANPRRRVRTLLATENGARRLAEEGLGGEGPGGVAPTLVRPSEIDRRLGPDAVHQGLLALAEPLEPLELEDAPRDGILLALDQVTDPHNVGAVVRSAVAFGARGLIVTARHSPEATGVLAKAASGALEHLPFIVVRNLAEALIALGDEGHLRVGLDAAGATDLGDAVLAAPLVLVLGAEGRGLRERTRSCCDLLARIEAPGPVPSLNVSNAAAVALYVAARRLSTGSPG